MTRSSMSILAICLVAVSAASALAQTTAPPAGLQIGNTVLVARYQCNPAELTKVDQALKDLTAPVLNRMVAEGKLISWGVLATYVGGPENRTVYVWAKDPVALMKARSEYLPELMSKPGWSVIAGACTTQETSIHNLTLMATPPVK